MTAPAPLVGPDVDVSRFDGFMLNVRKLLESALWAASTGEEFKAALGLWAHAWLDHPPGSLPDDDKILAGYSGAGARWKKVKGVALRGFVKCSDGRIYHRVLCENVLDAWGHHQAFKARTANATEARRQRNDRRRPGRDEPPDGQRGDLFDGQRNEHEIGGRERGGTTPVLTNGSSRTSAPALAASPPAAADSKNEINGFETLDASLDQWNAWARGHGAPIVNELTTRRAQRLRAVLDAVKSYGPTDDAEAFDFLLGKVNASFLARSPKRPLTFDQLISEDMSAQLLEGALEFRNPERKRL